MQIETLLMIAKENKVLLGLKNPKKKFGGKWNGWGGKVEEGENIEECLIREINEEAEIKVIYPKEKGRIQFIFPTKEIDHYVHIFASERYKGILKPSEDFIEYKWFDINNLPENMMAADKYWIPWLFKKNYFKGIVKFDTEMINPKVELKKIDRLS